MSINKHLLTIGLYLFILSLSLWGVNVWLGLSGLESVLFTISLVLIVQGFLSTYAMFYTFLDEKRLLEVRPWHKTDHATARHNFTLIVPARNEEKVIVDTIEAMDKINYPKHRYEVIFVVRADDTATLKAVYATIKLLAAKNMWVIQIDGDAFTKSYSLNIGMHHSRGNVVAIFDAEDEPSPDILHHIDAEFINDKDLSVVQSAIQLINVSSNWYSALNCLEYYFWFKSVLPMLAKIGVAPLGGNSIFMRKQVLKAVGSWDEKMLTEDADIGIRLAKDGYKIKVIYEERLATLEEAANDEAGLIRQRTRWDQGFLQVLFKGDWLQLSHNRQRVLLLYILIQPLFRHVALFGMLFLPLSSTFFQVPLLLSLFSFVPAYFLVMQLGLYWIGLSDLKKSYHLKFSPLLYLSMILTFFPYQLLLTIASLRAFVRMVLGVNSWEKTMHLNVHRR